jgi:DNA replication and repair protein RecF
MIVTEIATEHFRNLADQLITPGSQFNVIAGENAQGKTNFLEAVSLMATLRSFRATRTAEMVRFGEQTARVRAVVQHDEMRRELQLELRDGQKRATIDGKATRGWTGYLGQLQTVLFTAEDLRVPRGAPAERRRLIDRAILTIWPAYAATARDYLRALQSRNRLLKQRPPAAGELLEVYEEQLAELGAKMIASRVRYLNVVGVLFGEVFAQIMRSGPRGTLAYVTASPTIAEARDNLRELNRALRSQLVSCRGVDLARQTTTVGPHTDDIDFRLDGRSTRSYGSQGQVRAMVLAFRLAQVTHAFESCKTHPVVLLDDVSSELDTARNDYLFDFIEKTSCQTFLTTTRAEIIPIINNRLDFQVVDGLVREGKRV